MRNVSNRHRLRLTLTLLPVLLVGCAISPQQPRSPQPGSPAPIENPAEPVVSAPVVAPIPVSPASPPEAPTEVSPQSSSASTSLLNRAWSVAMTGDYEQAITLLERAQRIDPTNADIYLAMVRTYLAKGDTRQARATAERGLLYCNSVAQCDQLRGFAQ